jgi:hypothetical protein
MRTHRLQRSPEALFRIVGRDLYLASPHRPNFDVLSGSATTIWRALEVAPTLEELIEALADAHGAQRDAIEADVGSFVDELRERGWVVTRS